MAENRSTWAVATAEETPELKMAGFNQCLVMYGVRDPNHPLIVHMDEARRSIRRRAGGGEQ